MALLTRVARAALLAGALVIGAAAGAAAQTAFPKFSPLERFAGATLTGPATLSLPFGAPLAVVEEQDEAIRVTLPDGGEAWLRRSDVFVSRDGAMVTAGRGYMTVDRPRLRFWRGHAALSDFVGRARATESGADYEEVLVARPTAALALPLVAEDVTDVLGKRAARIAEVMIPVHGKLPERFAEVAGQKAARFDVHLTVDFSGDAAAFTQETLGGLAREAERRLRDAAPDISLSLTYFGNNINNQRVTVDDLDWSQLGRPFRVPIDRSRSQGEPLLQALAARLPAPVPGRAAAVQVILSGGDLIPTFISPALGGRVDLDTVRFDVPSDTTLIFAQVTPEPGDDLARLARRVGSFAKAEYLPYGPKLASDLAARIVTLLRPGAERRLDDAELAKACDGARAAGLFCALPIGATTDTRMPPTPTRAPAPDWYSIYAWTVVDGLNLQVAR